MGFRISSLLRHFPLLLLLLMASLGMCGHGKGNCGHLEGATLKLICNGRVPDYIFLLYRDQRAPAHTPYSVWETDSSDTILVTFHDNYLHHYNTMQVDYYNPVDMRHTFSMSSSRGHKTINIRPSLLYCIPISLRYPMELRASCLGKGRSGAVASKPVLHYAINDIRTRGRSDSASSLSPYGILMIVAVFGVVFCKNRIYV